MERTSGTIKVLVADYDRLTCRLLASRLRKHKPFEVTECCESPSGVLESVVRVSASVALVSAILRDAPAGGFAVVRNLRSSCPSVRAVMLLDRPDKHVIVDAFRYGAKGVFIRDSYDFTTLCKCVHRVQDGQIWADSQQMQFVLEAFSAQDAPQHSGRSHNSLHISEREGDVVRLVTDGLSNREIAKELGLSEHTVKNYVFRIFDKLGVSNRVELVNYALGHRELLGHPGTRRDSS